MYSDRVNPARFYSFNSKTSKLSVSQDKGHTFTENPTALAEPGRDWSLAVAPGLEGDLWIGAANQLFHSTDGGTTFVPVEGVGRAMSVGFGKEAPGKSYPTLFLTGEWSKTDGIYRSEDVGKTWMRIDDPAHQYGWVKAAIGDPRIYGRVYLATGGRGIIYGDIAVPRAARSAGGVPPPPPKK